MQSVGRPGRRARVPGQGRDPVRAGRRHRRHGAHRAAGRLRQRHRLRHGRHVDRRVALRRRVRARVRDAGRRRAHARADDEHPHRRRRRRLDPRASTARACASGPHSAGANPGPASYRRGGPLAVTDCQRAARQDPAGVVPEGVRHGGRRGARRATSSSTQFDALAAEIDARHRPRRARPRRSPRASSTSPSAAWPTRSRRSRWRAATTSRATRCSASAAPAASTPACVADALGMTTRLRAPAGRRAVGLRHGPGRPGRDARGGGRAAAGRRRAARDPRAARRAGRRGRRRDPPPGRGLGRRSACMRRAHVRYEGTDSALVVDFGDGSVATLAAGFEAAYRQRFAFLMEGRGLIVEAVSVEAIAAGDAPAEPRVAAMRADAGARHRDACACTARAAGGTPRWSCARRCAPATSSTARPSSPRRTRPPSSSPAGRRASPTLDHLVLRAHRAARAARARSAPASTR